MRIDKTFVLTTKTYLKTNALASFSVVNMLMTFIRQEHKMPKVCKKKVVLHVKKSDDIF